MKPRLWITSVLGVIVLWVITLGAIHYLHSLQPTADSVAAWAQKQDWNSLSAEERARRLQTLADQMNQLTFAERQKMTAKGALKPVIRQMTDEEKLSLMDKTLPKGFAQLMDSLNRMKPEDRKRLVSQALENMKKWNPQPGWDDAAVQKVAQTGFSSYLQNASADTKLDMAPLIEQIQVSMQGLGNGAP